MLIGYCRVSTAEQNLDLQLDALKIAGCEEIFRDVASGALDSRKGLGDALARASSGDTIVVWRLDRLGRNLKHLIEVVNELNQRGVAFKSMQEALDTTSPGGRLIFHIFGSLCEFERDVLRQRTMAGLTAARARGRIGGRPLAMDAGKIAMARTLLENKGLSISRVCEAVGVSKPTLYRSLRRQ
ncbi:recombinase family protein [Bdellovibrionota bacterium FG-2]